MPGTLDDVNCISPTPTTSSSGGDARDFKEWSRNSRSSSALDRHSESSDSLDNQSTCSGNGRQEFGSNELIPTRSTKASPKPAYNPMQFVKTGPTKLVLTAQQQIKKADEIKKIREETKKDDAEEWQANLEGWKSSRRKRQEHVIERVTEVKRMEQEEALKASEAAAKKLMGIREKRGKLTALYSVEDNDQIEFDFDPTEGSSSSSNPTGDPAASSSNCEGQAPVGAGHSSPARQQVAAAATQEYTYDKAIEDYVKFSNAALSKSDALASSPSSSPRNVRRSASHADVADVKLKAQPIPKSANPLSANPDLNEDHAEGVLKRRSLFERSSSIEEKSSSSSSSSSSRKSGDFSSTFKNRLSTFESGGECVTSAPAPASKVVIAEESADEEQLNFKAKLAAFRQVESGQSKVTAKAKINNEVDYKGVEGDVSVVSAEGNRKTPSSSVSVAVKPALPLRNSLSIIACVSQPDPEPEPELEPIYANASVTTANIKLECADEAAVNPAIETPLPEMTPLPLPLPLPLPMPLAFLDESFSPRADESDCTEDEGIRSLSPHATPSPTSPAHTQSAASISTNDPGSSSSSAFFLLDPKLKDGCEKTEPAGATGSAPASTWPSTEVWPGDGSADWLVGGANHNVTPPTEKPPPPPCPCPDDDALSLTIDSPQVTEEIPAAAGNQRKEWRQHRSHFLGFDVKAMEDGNPSTAIHSNEDTTITD